MNVSKDADARFMEELKRTDRPRYDRILRAALKETHRLQRICQPIETQRECQHCGLVLPADLRADAKYCDATCKRNAAFAKTRGRPLRMAA